MFELNKKWEKCLVVIILCEEKLILLVFRGMDIVRRGGKCQNGFVFLLKRALLPKEKNGPLWSKFFPFRVDLFSGGVLLCRKATRYLYKVAKFYRVYRARFSSCVKEVSTP